LILDGDLSKWGSLSSPRAWRLYQKRISGRKCFFEDGMGREEMLNSRRGGGEGKMGVGREEGRKLLKMEKVQRRGPLSLRL